MTAVIPEVEAADVTTVPPGEDVENGPALEARWPPIAAVLAFLALNVGLRLWLADEVLVGVRWLAPAIEVLLIIALLAADPTRLSRRPLWLRRLPLALVLVLVAGALWATALLLYHLITGAEVTDSPGRLLAAGALVWLGNNLIFALLYWLIDNGGPVARASRPSPFPDFAFQQQLDPELAPPGWRPTFADYLHLGFTNATAFSPTDVMPLTLRAKYTMVVQSTVALALFGVVVARSVNTFS
jgi:uncharacterized membrane protein